MEIFWPIRISLQCCLFVGSSDAQNSEAAQDRLLLFYSMPPVFSGGIDAWTVVWIPPCCRERICQRMNTASPAFAGAILALEMEAALMIIQYMVV
jgi:hypothetical protein